MTAHSHGRQQTLNSGNIAGANAVRKTRNNAENPTKTKEFTGQKPTDMEPVV